MQNIKQLMKKVIVCKSIKVKKVDKLLQQLKNIEHKFKKLAEHEDEYSKTINDAQIRLDFAFYKLDAKRNVLLIQLETLLTNIVLMEENEKHIRILYNAKFIQNLLNIKRYYNYINDSIFNIVILALFAEYYKLSKNRRAFLVMCMFEPKLLQIAFKNKSIYDVFPDALNVEIAHGVIFYIYNIISSFFFNYEEQFKSYVRKTKSERFIYFCNEYGYRMHLAQKIPEIEIDEEIPF